MNQPKTKGHGYFRKSKAYGLIPILALGTLATMGSTVSADETVSTTPSVTTATTLTAPQPAPSKDNTDLAQEAGQTRGELLASIPSPDLDQEVLTATDAGVVVTKEETVTHDSLAKAQADLDKQTQALKETTKTQQDLDTAQAKAKAAAQKAGVTVTEGETKTYTDIEAAKADLDKQTEALKTATETQSKAQVELDQALQAAKAQGVTVQLAKAVTYSESLKALEALNTQLAQLDKVNHSQAEMDQLLSEAIKTAQAKGLVVTMKDRLSTTDLRTALDLIKKQATTLSELELVKEQLNQELEAIKTKASEAGVIVTETPVKTYTDQEIAKAETTKAMTALETILKQKEGDDRATKAAQSDANQKLEEAKTKAEQAGLIVTAGQAMTVTSPEAAQAETQKQVEVVTKTLETKERLDQLLAEAKKSAQGLSLTTGATKTYTDLAAALADAKAQQEAVTKAQATQASLQTETMKRQAQLNDALIRTKKAATQAGLELSESESKQYETVAEAQADLDKQVESLTKAQNTQQAANYLLEVAEAKAKQAGTPVVSKGTLTLTAEAAKAKASELSSAIEAVIKANEAIIKANETGKATETSNKAEVDRYNETTKAENRRVMEVAGLVYTGNYQNDLATVENYNNTNKKETTEENARRQADYERQLAEMQAKIKEPGHLSEVAVQHLVNASEPHAKAHVTTTAQKTQTFDVTSKEFGELEQKFGFKHASDAYKLNVGETLTVHYTNLTNSSYQGQKITSLTRTFTNVGELAYDFVPMQDPTDGSFRQQADFAKGSSKLKQVDVYYLEDGKKLVLTDGALVSLSSLNADAQSHENAIIENGRVIEITGSSVKAKGNTTESTENATKGGSNLYATDEWDFDNSGLEWYGSAVAKVNDNADHLTMTSVGVNRYRVWFKTNTDIKVPVIPALPPKKEAKPEIAIKPLKNYDHKPFTPTPLKEAEVYRIQVEAATHPIVLAKAEPQTVELHEIKLSLPVSPVTLVNEKTYRVSLNPLTFTTAVQGVTLATTVNLIELTAEAHDVRLETAVHPVQVTQKPINVKHVINSDTVDINGQTIPKGSTVTWTLTNNPLEAGRDKVTAYTLKDPLPAGFELDLEASMTASPDWLFTQEESGKLTITASQALLTKLNANRDQAVALPMVSLVGRVLHDNGSYQNTFKTLITTPSGSYTVVSNTPKITTPTPPRPVKSITDQAGANLNGASTFDKHVTFHLMTDYSPYRLVTVSQDMISKGFVILDDVEDGAYTIDEAKIAITASDKTDVKALFTMYHVLSNEARTEAIQAILDQAGLSPVGEFYLWVAKDPASFYTHYVKQAKNMTIDLPARLLVKAGEVVTNDFFQGDFGNTYQSNLVTVQVPDVNPAKHALDKENDTKILDGQEVNIGEYIRYFLDGVTVPVKHDTLWQYEGKDKLDTTHDRYTGHWKGFIKGTEYTAKEDLVLAYDVTTKDGQLIKAGETIPAGSTYAFSFTFDQDTNSDFIKKIVTVTWDKEKGEWSYQIDKAFLNSLGVEGSFDADFYLEVERIASGKVDNTFVNIVNGKEMSAKVTTHTPEPPQPVTPKGPALPSTGEQGVSILTVLGAGLLSLLGYVGLKKRQQ
ncbi:agglutinin receptor [Streptococcus canis]|uniref:SspB-related isopeptide-forming adhesin n=1 Tax=Streptococcus canis TaxID=1329 RepID=UPI00145460A5|nr:SspB-related isopeptide-forming adhesin [Streptococcus canis]GFK30389.1 agglutinin receptor [Streptococcus canis]